MSTIGSTAAGSVTGDITNNSAINFNQSDASTTFANAISGTTTLSGTNTYSGATTVNTGTGTIAAGLYDYIRAQRQRHVCHR